VSASLIAAIRGALEKGIVALGVDPPLAVPLEVPPKPELGDLATPIAFELAKRLKRAPKMIAATLAPLVEGLEGIARVEIAGAGYLNVYFDRDLFLRELARGGVPIYGINWRDDRAKALAWLDRLAPGASPRLLSPLPIFGFPGWHPGTARAEFYDDARYFRPSAVKSPSESARQPPRRRL